MAKKALIAVSGGIAVYKVCQVVSDLGKRGVDVQVIMTENATKFVTPLTFQTLSRNPVYVETFAPVADWKPEHISLAEAADVALVAPATANTLAKLRFGLADNLLTETLLATRARLFVAPAMNAGMWEAAATRENLSVLAARGVTVIAPGVGELACGTAGAGRMAEPSEIFGIISKSV